MKMKKAAKKFLAFGMFLHDCFIISDISIG